MRLVWFCLWPFVIGVSVGLPPHWGRAAWPAYAGAVLAAAVIWWGRDELTELLADALGHDGCPRCRQHAERQRQDAVAALEWMREQMAKDAHGRVN